MSNFQLRRAAPPAALALLLALSMPASAQKQRIEKEADIPRFSYRIDEPLEKVVRDPVLFKQIATPIRADMEGVLARYDIADKSSERGMLTALMALDFLLGNYDAALAESEKVRALEEKPADKLLSGIRLRAMVAAARQTGAVNTPAYFEAVGKAIRAELDTYPYPVIANDVKQFKASAEVAGEGRVLGGVRDVLQDALNKNGGSLSSDIAPNLIFARYSLETAIPLKQTLIDAYGGYLAAHAVAKKDIWAERSVTLPAAGPYKPVVVAVWDSGVDTRLFGKQVLLDKGKPAVIAFDLEARRASGELFPIPAAYQPKLPSLLQQSKGFSDLQSNIDSPEASEVKKTMSGLKPEEFKPAMEGLGLAGNYSHGTHVAGIALAGNPWARLLTARISFDYKLQPDPCPSQALAERSAGSYQTVVDYFKQQHVRVVNMSWGGSVKDVEEGLEKCGIGKTVEERKATARKLFEIDKKGMTKAFASAPEILFVTAAGNSNSDASFGEFIPSSIVLPNLLTVGAVDLAGDEASFTSYGPTVAVHANGYQVESYLPGGMRVAFSGTSMASPNVTNLAAKLIATKPSLKPAQVIAIIKETSEPSADGRRRLVHPAHALARVTGGA
ncbi:S8 family serine peptidase [Roseateles cellulosilyticus]|uniref:S8 family serine peptidase n=1 Tax=Pelomonas cellulosilytica TaxID=2906762 RepID=A0ABS8XSB0_9BURK|nr:S8 family serine peptidase [Pelomonas sp. P8]MCE4555602.1 S8 family serine peptidase [Pelomonas sp. P8]